jgi:hypothetical protein
MVLLALAPLRAVRVRWRDNRPAATVQGCDGTLNCGQLSM